MIPYVETASHKLSIEALFRASTNMSVALTDSLKSVKNIIVI